MNYLTENHVGYKLKVLKYERNDSIIDGNTYTRYNNEVPVDKRVFKNVKLFMENKKDGDDLFDRLNTSVSIILRDPLLNISCVIVSCYPCQVLNQYLNGLMDGLTAKVFRYTASNKSTIKCKVVC